MIRIERAAEPPNLEQIRAAELIRVRDIPDASSKEIGDRYRELASLLRAQQRFKCCYCENFVRLSFNDVEHLRPKASADRRPGSVERHGYWWLAWTWENLLFACPNCNRSGKNNAFPLAEGSVPLRPEEQPPGERRCC